MVYRNVEQLELHLAALENGVGKDSGCKSADIAVRDLMRIGISAREAKQDRARQQSEHRKAVEKAQDLVEPKRKSKRKSIQPFITASMASSTVRAFCCDTSLLIYQFSRDARRRPALYIASNVAECELRAFNIDNWANRGQSKL